MVIGVISQIASSNISISRVIGIVVTCGSYLAVIASLMFLIIGDYIKLLEMDSDILYAYLMRTGIIVCTFNVCKLFFLNLIGFKIHLCAREEPEDIQSGNISSPCPACGHKQDNGTPKNGGRDSGSEKNPDTQDENPCPQSPREKSRREPDLDERRQGHDEGSDIEHDSDIDRGVSESDYSDSQPGDAERVQRDGVLGLSDDNSGPVAGPSAVCHDNSGPVSGSSGLFRDNPVPAPGPSGLQAKPGEPQGTKASDDSLSEFDTDDDAAAKSTRFYDKTTELVAQDCYSTLQSIAKTRTQSPVPIAKTRTPSPVPIMELVLAGSEAKRKSRKKKTKKIKQPIRYRYLP